MKRKRVISSLLVMAPVSHRDAEANRRRAVRVSRQARRASPRATMTVP